MLAASCVETVLSKTAWINLDTDDSEAATLFFVLVHSLKHSLEWQDVSNLLSCPAIDMGPRVPKFRYREWAHVLFDGISGPVYIVFDGLDRLKTESTSFNLIQALIEQAPGHVHFILLSREEPPLEIQKFRVAQEVGTLYNEDLAFNFDEICIFFNQIRSFDLNTEILKRIHQITEGWAGGIVLISENLDHLPVRDHPAFLFKEIPVRFKEAVFNYFLEEVLHFLPDHVYEFLVRSSVFDIIEPRLVENVLEIEKSQEFLLDLTRKNLFIHSRYDDENGWNYQYHQLFKEILQSRFRTALTSEQQKDIFLKGGDAFEKKGDHKRAIEFYIKAGAHDKGIASIEKIGMTFLEKGRSADLIQWLDALPEERLDQSPWLLYFLCMTRRFTGVRENLKCLPKVISTFRQQNIIKGEIQALSAMLESLIAAGCAWNVLGDYLDQAEKLLDTVPVEVYPYEKAVLLSQFGYGHTVRGNLQTGRSALQEAFLLALNLGNQILQVTVACHMIVNLTMQNNFSKAQKYAENLDELIGDSTVPELQVLNLVAKSILASFRGEQETAGRLLDSAQNHVNDNGLIYYLPIVLMYRVFYCVFCDRHAEMEEVGHQLVNLAKSMNNPVLVASTTFFLGVNAYRRQQYQKAEQIINLAGRLCSPAETNIQMQWYANKVVACLVALHREKSDFQKGDIHEALEYFRKQDCTCLLAETYMAAFLIEKRENRYDQARKHLSRGFEMSLRTGHRHFLMLNRSDLISVCLWALMLPCRKIQHHATSFLCQHPFDAVIPKLEKKALILLENNREKSPASENKIIFGRDPEIVFNDLAGIFFLLLDSEDARILSSLCYVKRITPAAAKILAGRTAWVRLKRFSRFRSFVYADTSDGGSISYRFQPRFQKFLQTKAPMVLSGPEHITVLCRSADLMSEQNGPEQAVRLFVQAGCAAKGADVILKQAPVLWDQGHFRELEQMIALLPREIVDESQYLVFWQGMCQLPMSPEIAEKRIMQALDIAEARSDPDGCFLALSGVLEAVYYQFDGFHDSDFFLEKAVQLQTRFGKIQPPEIELKLTGAILHSLIFRDPVSDAARNWIARGWWISQQVKTLCHAAPVFLPMILLRVLQGNLSGAGHLLKRFDRVPPETLSPLVYLVLQNLKAFHAWLSGNFHEGLEAIEKGLEVEKETGINLIFSNLRVQGAASAIGAGRCERARQFLDQITPVISHQGLWIQGWYHFVFAWLALVTGSASACRFHALAGFEKIKQTGCEMALACCHLLLAKMHGLFNENQEALIHLDQSLILCDKYGVEQCRFMALLARASLLMDGDMDDTEMVATLRAGMRLGREQLYRFGFAWNQREMAHLCAEALKREIEPDYVRSLIVTCRLMPEVSPLEIRQWPWPVSLYCLGQFKVIVNGEAVRFSRKAQYKPLAMLKFILAGGGRHVPDYAIQDAIWPDSDGDAAHNAFTTTLHRLRNLLVTPDVLIYREGVVSCNTRLVWSDTWALEHICQSLDQLLDRPWSADRIRSVLDDLLALYRGPFIPDEPAAWAILERQRLKALFLEIIQKTARRFERQQQWHQAIRCYRQALTVEATAEVFYENLMRIYARMGKPGEVLLVYRQYKAVLSARLGMSPSPRLKGLCRAICGKTSGI
jgi:ATP/maltotriose-dependent transcriptional regulator MalT/two-component SAPR family response regulator